LAIFFQARHNGQNYVFALLTGYRDPPAGISVNFSPIFALDLLLQLQIVGS
jgi:ubiquinol-cytochrome c reductase cytochrome c1 subunit